MLSALTNTARTLLSSSGLKSDIPEEITTLAQERWQAKKERNFAKADELREKISNLGYEIKDTREGFEIIKK